MPKTYVLANSRVRAQITIDANRVHEKYYGMANGKEILLAESRSDSSFGACNLQIETHKGKDIPHCFPDEPVVLFNGSPDEYTETPKLSVGEPLPKVIFQLFDHSLEVRDQEQELKLLARSPQGDVLERRIALEGEADYFQVSNELRLERDIDLEYFTDYYVFSPGPDPDFTWTPHLKYDPSCVSSDWTFKSPSLMVQKKNSAVALVPDLDFLYTDESILYSSAGLDLDITTAQGPTMGYGLIPCEPHYHSMFIHPVGLKHAVPKGRTAYQYFLFLDGNAPERQIYRRVVDFLWQRFGRRNFLNGHQAQQKSFNVMEKEAWHWMGRKFWIEFDYQGKRCGGFRDYHRELEDDIWFFGWWNSLRTAYGMERYARRRDHPETSRKAKAILDLITGAPRKSGAFPAVYLVLDGKRVWTAGSPSNFGGPIHDYHTFSMSWTAYWLLKWKTDLVMEDERLMPICTDYAEFLLKNQRESGFIPSYYKETDLSVDEALGMNKGNAEPAVCALFLTEMYKVTNDERYIDAAEKAVRYVEREMMPGNKWFDYETFYSCSPKEYGYYDKITGQYAQCNMALIMMAHVCLELHRLRKEKGFLDLGRRVLDYLCLFQQVWSHPRMELNLIGGFATQNTDSEWSDSRQSYCAVLFMEYFEETGERVFFERGVAAMRATLAISPYENWSHRGYNDEPGFFSSFHWGIGTGLTTEEILYEKYGDIYADIDRGFAYGLNGCTVTDYRKEGGTVALTVESNIHYVTPLKMICKAGDGKKIRLVMNGEFLGEFNSKQLAQGIEWDFKKMAR
jgi:hypothetical protein